MANFIYNNFFFIDHIKKLLKILYHIKKVMSLIPLENELFHKSPKSTSSELVKSTITSILSTLLERHTHTHTHTHTNNNNNKKHKQKQVRDAT